MTGRVLSQEAIKDIEDHISYLPAVAVVDVVNLIATIRDRDKAIAEMYCRIKEQNDLLQEELKKSHQQNTILRKALEKIVFETNPTNRHGNTAREAFAKINGPHSE